MNKANEIKELKRVIESIEDMYNSMNPGIERFKMANTMLDLKEKLIEMTKVN